MFEHFGVDFRAIVWVDFLNDFLANFCQFLIVFWMFWINLDFELRWVLHKLLLQLPYTGPPRLARPPRPGPCLDFGFQYALIRNNRLKKFGVEYWALPGSNSPWRPCDGIGL